MEHFILALAISLVAGAISGMGFGGGSILIVYLTAFVGVSQTAAQGINLFYFIPGALLAVPIHIKAGNLSPMTAVYLALGGVLGALAGAFLAFQIAEMLLSKIFAAGVIALGLYELFGK